MFLNKKFLGVVISLLSFTQYSYAWSKNTVIDSQDNEFQYQQYSDANGNLNFPRQALYFKLSMTDTENKMGFHYLVDHKPNQGTKEQRIFNLFEDARLILVGEGMSDETGFGDVARPADIVNNTSKYNDSTLIRYGLVQNIKNYGSTVEFIRTSFDINSISFNDHGIPVNLPTNATVCIFQISLIYSDTTSHRYSNCLQHDNSPSNVFGWKIIQDKSNL